MGGLWAVGRLPGIRLVGYRSDAGLVMDPEFAKWWGEYTAPANVTGVHRILGAVEAAYAAGRAAGILEGRKELDKRPVFPDDSAVVEK